MQVRWIEGAGGNASSACRLMLSESLEGSGLHEKLAELAGGGEGLESLVDRTGEPRAVSFASGSPEGSGALPTR